MSQPFPEPILNLPQADIPIPGLSAYLSQADDHQIIFMHFSEDAQLGVHSHAAQWGLVLEGSISLTMHEATITYTKGQRYFIPAGVKHAAKIHAGYADMTFFDEPERYSIKKTGEP